MRALSSMAAPVLVAAGLVVVPMASAPNASAGCVKTNGISVCDSGSEAGSGPSVPYPCDLDWYCYDGSTWDLGLDIDVPPPPRPDNSLPRPDRGRPGTPGGGGGGGIGGRR
ncbi:hypothetical protein MJO55_06805 [Mycolicibacterium rufum]|uniref:Uncharacterized protein n=1 Tax=Mycolicibacterium rufum TaxID=318424 RepID=A0ABY3UKW7_9MYCO|nr:hypothetical protein [Mycolicibacterium rufum]ULP38131.1 hypothetical protein MJO55_06805 [Mycolicibacterium rufum]